MKRFTKDNRALARSIKLEAHLKRIQLLAKQPEKPAKGYSGTPRATTNY